MTLPITITVIGAGSASFGENTLAALMHSPRLRGSTLRLVDRNASSLNIVHRLANRLNVEWDAQMKISAHAHHQDALDGAQFVVSAIEVGHAKNCGARILNSRRSMDFVSRTARMAAPAEFAHAARNVLPVLEIARAMEQACPDAWFINFTNPMVRICDLVNRHTKIKAVGLCHQILIGYCFVGMVLSKELGIKIPDGITGMQADMVERDLPRKWCIRRCRWWISSRGRESLYMDLSIRDKRTGEDLYPIFRERFASFDPSFEPLTRDVFNAFGWFPVPGDTHLCEYLPWVADPLTKPWDKYNIRLYEWDKRADLRDLDLAGLDKMAKGEMTIDGLLDADSEGALEMIENIAGNGNHYHIAANLPNVGQISDLPIGSTVETPVFVDGAGIHPVHVGELPEGIAELCRRELIVAQLCVNSAVEGSREKALQCLLFDPMITDMDRAKAILDDYLITYKEYLPQFWK